MATRAKKTVSITINLTPEQIREAYFQLIKSEHEDWFYEPEVAEELLRRGKKARKEVREGKAVDWEDFRKELDV